jgi:hypothetical protein
VLRNSKQRLPSAKINWPSGTLHTFARRCDITLRGPWGRGGRAPT